MEFSVLFFLYPKNIKNKKILINYYTNLKEWKINAFW